MFKEQVWMHTTAAPNSVFLAPNNCKIPQLLADLFMIPGNRGKPNPLP